MPKWLDELEAQPDEDPRKKYLLAALVVVVALLLAWNFEFGSAPPPVPPPSVDVYRAAVPEIARAAYEGSILEITVDKRWNRLEPGERTDRVVSLIESTGSFEYDRIRIRDTDGVMLASVNAASEITWIEGPP